MRTEKIVTIYPTMVKPGLAVSHFMPPDPVSFVSEYPSKCSFYLTSLMYFEHGKKYTTELDVFFNGKSVLSDNNDNDNSMETFMFSPINDSLVMVGSSLLIQNAKLIENGAYDITFKLYEQIDGALGDLIDEKTCAIISATKARG
jgi:hypothetical protein